MPNGLVVLLCAVVLVTRECDTFRILGLYPLPIKSHFIFFEKLMKELADRGHEVYVVSHYPQKDPKSNYHDISINGSLSESINKISVRSAFDRGILGRIKYIFRTCGGDVCEQLFYQQPLRDLKNSNLKFDVVLSEVYGTDCLLGFAHHFDAIIIGISATDLLPWAASRMGNSDNPSYVPNFLLATNDKMILYEKLAVLAGVFLMKIWYLFLSTAGCELKSREFFGKNVPLLNTLAYNTSLLFVNSHLSLTTPLPMVPGIIEVGGLHIGSPKPLPQDLEKIVRSSNEGVIYFSMGTVINMKTIAPETLEIIVNALSKMPQTIIWSGTLQGVIIPNNIIVVPWIEQIDLLCHPKLLVFITHGGLMSMQEAAYCAKPILGIPIFPDHQRYVNKYVNNRAGLSLDFDYLTVESIRDSLNDLITNTTYKKNAERISKTMKERPMSALDTAVYWTEYVVKFGGARHLRTKSAELTWFEYYLVDCIIIVIMIAFLMIFTMITVMEYLRNYMDNKKPRHSRIERKKQKDKDT